ncbi:MAG: S-layer protein domain-containing protein [Methanolobus sp.]|nr:S-layer protein domain-containing protein [Methanolobus sp.]
MFTGGAIAAPSLSGGTVSPSTGTATTSFDFTISYIDADNTSADYVNVTIDGVSYSMSESDPADTNNADGKDYTYTSSGFSKGPHDYAFFTANSNGTAGPSGSGSFSITNSAPVLSSPNVSPASGSPADNYVFTVTYTDDDNDSPSYVNVTIDGTAYSMSSTDAGDTNTADGKGYTHTGSGFSTGTHSYSFSTSDGTDAVGPEGAGTFDVSSDSSLTGSISSSSGTPSTTFNFNATFTNGNDAIPDYVRVTIDGTDYDMIEVDPADVTTSDGKEYGYSNSGFSVDSHSYSFTAGVGSDVIGPVGSGTFDVDVSNHQPTLTDAEVSAPDKFIVGKKIYFNITYTDSDNDAPSFMYVQIDGTNATMSKQDSSDTVATNGIEYTYNTSSLDMGEHAYAFYASDGTYDVSIASANFSIHSKTYYSGDRIWDADAGQSTTYTWDANSFSGFFYDLDSGISSETMTITDIDRSIGDGDLVYETVPVDTEFEHSGWGEYKVVGFMAEKYFAAYTDDTDIDGVETLSMMSNGQLSKVLIDNDDKKSVYSGSALVLQDGYRLNIVEADKNGDKVFITLTKDGDELDSGVVSGGSDYIYKTDLGDSDDVVLIAVHFDNIFSGSESNAVFVEGVFQISDEYIEVDDYSDGKMEVTSVGSDKIQMKNDGSISLSAGDTIEIMGKINFIVADSNTLRFAPVVDTSEAGTYELRSTVSEGTDPFIWTPLNFEGFYYDIDEGIQTETLEVQSISGRTIDDGELIYTSTPKEVSFEHSDWGKFSVIGFMAEKYFAGYPSGAFGDSDSYNLLSSGQLSRVLIDDDDKRSVYTGASLILEEGYVLNIEEVDKNGDRVLLSLTKDGDKLDETVVSSGDTYIYEEDLGDSDNVPIVAVYFDEIFSSSESNAVFVEGIFQVSDDYLELESGDSYGAMEITSLGDSIVMKNDDSISLSKDKDSVIMENSDDDKASINVKVADSDTLRYYFYVEKETAPTGTLKVDLDNSVVTKGDEVTITVTSRGAAISDATVKVEDSSIGKTDDEGTITYTANQVGKLEIIAEKTGYTSGSEDLEVISPNDETKKIIIEVSPDDVYEGTSTTIFVLKAIGGDAIQGAEVTLDGKSIGSTSLDGTITYTMTDAGMHKLKATKSGFIDAELDLEVQELAAKFEFTNLRTSPLDVKAGKEATISVDVTNTGTAAGEYTVDLRINDTVVASQPISLGIDESQTVEFKHTEEEAGTYVVKVSDLTTTYEVFGRSSTVWYVLGAIVLVGAGGLGYLFTAGGWTVEIAQAKVEEAIQAVQELVGNLR